jgi:hypothetical protein
MVDDGDFPLSAYILCRLRTITLVQRGIVTYDVPSIVVELFKIFAEEIEFAEFLYHTIRERA